jgi:hypothetical protein
MSTSPEAIADGDLEGTVSNKFIDLPSYRAAADNKDNELIFPSGMCVYFELQYDPITLMHSNYFGFKTILECHHRLT